MVELDESNVFMMKKILCGNKYKLNIFQGSFIEGEYSVDIDIFPYKIKMENNKHFVKKLEKNIFDIIIGNPPYNDNREVPIYNTFIENSLDTKPLYLLFIVPSRWFAGGKGLDKFREMMLNRRDIKLIKHFNNNENIFGKEISIIGGVNYFLIDKKYNGLCNYNGVNIKLNKYDILISNPKIYTLIDKLLKYTSIEKIYERNYYNIKTNDPRLVNTQINSKYILCYVNKMMGFKNYINKNEFTDINNWKVLTPESNGEQPSFGNIFIKNPNEVNSQTYISFNVGNKTQAESLLSYLNCKLPNYMLSIRKNTQHICKNTIKWIPLPPLDRIWNDNNIYKYFDITNKEIKLITSK